MLLGVVGLAYGSFRIVHKGIEEIIISDVRKLTMDKIDKIPQVCYAVCRSSEGILGVMKVDIETVAEILIESVDGGD